MEGGGVLNVVKNTRSGLIHIKRFSVQKKRQVVTWQEEKLDDRGREREVSCPDQVSFCMVVAEPCGKTQNRVAVAIIANG